MDNPHLFSRRRCLAMASAWAVAPLAASPAWASEATDKPLRFVVPFGTGGNVDNVGRLMATAMSSLLGQPVVVDNRAGAGGSLGASLVAQNPGDGLVLLVGSNGPLTINPFVQSRLAYDPLRDLAPVALVGFVPHVLLAHNGLPARSLTELVALSQRQAINCASSGIGSATQLTLERFNAQTGARITHVPYRGGNTFVADVVGGSLQLGSMELSTALPLHKAGKARILAVAGAQRHPLAPDIPTFIESGVTGFTAQSYVGLLAPARTPAPVLKKWESTALAVLGTTDMAERLQSIGLQVPPVAERGATAFAAFLRAEFDRSRDAVKAAGIQPE